MTIRRDFFPYFATGRPITLLEVTIYGPDGKHHPFEDPAARTTDLQDNGALTLTFAADAAGPTQVLTRTAGKQVSIVIRYAVG